MTATLSFSIISGSFRRSQLPASWVSFRPAFSSHRRTCLEAPAGLVEHLAPACPGPNPPGLPAETEDPRWGHFEEENVADRKAPTFPVLRNVRLHHATQLGVVGHSYGLTLHDDVESFVEIVAARSDGDLTVLRQVRRLALPITGGEVERAVEPDGDKRNDVRPPFRPDCG